MRHKLLVSALNEVWALMPEKAMGYLPLIEKALNGNIEFDAEKPRDFISSTSFNALASPYFISEFGEANPVSNAPDNSISVISFNDVITKYDGWCSAGTITKSALLLEADKNDKILAHVLKFDTPGGEATAPEVMIDAIKICTKPVYAYVTGLCASAGYGIASACKGIYLSGKMNQLGSIGTFSTILDYSKNLEARGIKLIEVYAKQSTNKNIEVREALDGKPEKLQARLTEMQSVFEGYTREFRDNLIIDQEAYTGKIYLSEAAVAAGLADGISSFESFIAMVENDALSNQIVLKHHY